MLLPVFNGEKYLGEAIESVLDQTLGDFELVIIDDGSRDRSPEIAEVFAKKDPRVRIIRNPENLGVQKSLNRGLANARGEYVARIDSDDAWCAKEKLEEQVRFLENHPDYGLVGTSVVLIDARGSVVGYHRPALLDRDIRRFILRANQFQHPSVLFRKKAVSDAGSYSEKKRYRHVEDYELWLRIGTKWKFANLAGYFTKYRINPKGICLGKEFQQKKAEFRLARDYAKQYPGFPGAILVKTILFPFPLSLRSKFRRTKIFEWTRLKITGFESFPEANDTHCYDDEFFRQHIDWQDDYEKISDWIAANVGGETLGIWAAETDISSETCGAITKNGCGALTVRKNFWIMLTGDCASS